MTAPISESRDYGRRLIPHVIDEIANKDPERQAFLSARSQDPRDGWFAITFRTYANAINRCALLIISACGKPAKRSFPTIAYIGPQDARYVVLVFAAVKAGYRMLYISPRNSDQGQLTLFEKTECHIVAFPSNFQAVVQPWLRQRSMKTLHIPTLEECISEDQVPHVPYETTFEQAEWEPLCVLHTSGSTGIPKAIVATHGMLAISDAIHNHRDFNGYTHFVPAWAERAKSIFMPMPLFHSGALYAFICYAIYWDTPMAFGIPDKPLTSDTAMQCLAHLDVEAVVLPPSILEEMSRRQECLDTLKPLKVVAFVGGNLATKAGDRLVKNGVALQTTMNSTEFSPFPVYYQPNQELWNYFIFNEEMLGCSWDPAYDNSYELTVVRKDESHPGLQGFFYTFPDLKEYRTGDLYKPHPTLPSHWTYYGRADNIIVFSNGEKLNPVEFEEAVQSLAPIKGALVVGSNRFQAGLLVEPSNQVTSQEEKRGLIDLVWPLVDQVNIDTVKHGRISRNYIAIADKSFLRAGKGTIQRGLTVNLLSDEIDRLYERAEQLAISEVPIIDVKSVESVVRSIKEILELETRDLSLEPEADLFSAGIDSRQTVNVVRSLRAGLSAAGYPTNSQLLGPRTIYSNPTCRQLAEYVMHNIVKKNRAGSDDENAADRDFNVMKEYYTKYTRDLIKGDPGRPEIDSDNQTVVLTGSTGMLGSHLLDGLVRKTAVKRVICLNRAPDGGRDKQTRSMAERGLTISFTEKAEFYHADVSQPGFGLPSATYARLLDEADRIIHCAWPVNFNLATQSFEPHIRGVRRLADFSATARKRVAIVFLSTVSSVAQWDTTRGPVPELGLEDWRLPAENGYGRSKMVASRVLDVASTVGHFPAACIRLGQVAGPETSLVTGAWSRSDWLPSIIASSLVTGALPGDLGAGDRVDWLPVERASSLVLDIAGAVSTQINGYFHGVNPQATSWDQLVPAVRRFYGERIKEMVSLKEWVTRLENSQGNDPDAPNMNPSLNLISTFRAMSQGSIDGAVVFDTRRACALSPCLAAASSVTGKMMERWCSQWDF